MESKWCATRSIPNGILDWKKHFSSVLDTAILSILQISYHLHLLLQHLFQKMDVFFWYFNLACISYYN